MSLNKLLSVPTISVCLLILGCKPPSATSVGEFNPTLTMTLPTEIRATDPPAGMSSQKPPSSTPTLPPTSTVSLVPEEGRIIYVADSITDGAGAVINVREMPQGIVESSFALPAGYGYPVISPNGTKVAVLRLDEAINIALINIDGSNLRQLTHDQFVDNFPAWSPNEEKIAFVSSRGFGMDIYLADINGGDFQRLTEDMNEEYCLAWSPDGGSLIFQSARTPGEYKAANIFVIDIGRKAVEQLTEGYSEYNVCPVWAPDGRRIAFASQRDGEKGLYVMAPDGSEVTSLVDEDLAVTVLAWSPDGHSIIFAATRRGNEDIYVVDADGSHLRRLTDDPSIDTLPSWSPSGRQIAFQSDRDGKFAIFIMNADGSGLLRITDPAINAIRPTWLPAEQ